MECSQSPKTEFYRDERIHRLLKAQRSQGQSAGGTVKFEIPV